MCEERIWDDARIAPRDRRSTITYTFEHDDNEHPRLIIVQYTRIPLSLCTDASRLFLFLQQTRHSTYSTIHIVRVHIWYARGLSRFFFSFFFCYCFVFFLFLLCLDIPYLPAYFAQHITYPALISCDIRTITAPATHTDTYERHENGIRTHAYVKRTCVVGGMAFLYASSLSLSKCIYTNNTYSAHDEV